MHVASTYPVATSDVATPGVGWRAVGRRLPDHELSLVPYLPLNLAKLAKRHALVVCFYPGLRCGGDPGQEEHAVRALSWGQGLPTLTALNHRLVAVVSQGTQSLLEWAFRVDVHYMLVSDVNRTLGRALGLPVDYRESPALSKSIYEPTTIVVRDERVARVFHPAAKNDAAVVTDWIRRTHRT